jgi:hypothetical protein
MSLLCGGRRLLARCERCRYGARRDLSLARVTAKISPSDGLGHGGSALGALLLPTVVAGARAGNHFAAVVSVVSGGAALPLRTDGPASSGRGSWSDQARLTPARCAPPRPRPQSARTDRACAGCWRRAGGPCAGSGRAARRCRGCSAPCRVADPPAAPVAGRHGVKYAGRAPGPHSGHTPERLAGNDGHSRALNAEVPGATLSLNSPSPAPHEVSPAQTAR